MDAPPDDDKPVRRLRRAVRTLRSSLTRPLPSIDDDRSAHVRDYPIAPGRRHRQ